MDNVENTKSILIIRLSSLGDILLTTPLIRSIRTQHPSIRLDYVIRTQYLDCLRYNPYINNLLKYEDIENSFNNYLKSECQYDLIIDLQNNLRSRRLTNDAKSNILRFNKRNVDKFLLVHFKINRLKDTPPIPDRYALSVPGLRLDNEGLGLFIPGNIKSKLDKSGKYIGFCPGSRHFTKQWPEEYFVELGNFLVKNNYKVILFGGKSDREICSNIAGKIQGALDSSNDNNLLQTAEDMKQCLCVVCNDSGLMHTASAVRTPVLAIFGSTVKEFGFAPYKNKNLILENNFLSCRPCSHVGRNKCPRKHFKCMRDIIPSMVFEKICEMTDNL